MNESPIQNDPVTTSPTMGMECGTPTATTGSGDGSRGHCPFSRTIVEEPYSNVAMIPPPPEFDEDHHPFLGYVEPGFSTPARSRSRTQNKNIMMKNYQDLFFGTITKTTCPRRQSVLRYSSRPPWNSPDVMDVEEEHQQLQEEELGESSKLTTITSPTTATSPPPPPSPSRRRICLVSLENFQPTPIFGVNFPMGPTTENFLLKKKHHTTPTKRLKRSFFDDLDVEEESDDPDTTSNYKDSFPCSLLTMKRTRYHDHYHHGLLLGETSFVEY